jgi:hypothetical protein
MRLHEKPAPKNPDNTVIGIGRLTGASLVWSLTTAAISMRRPMEKERSFRKAPVKKKDESYIFMTKRYIPIILK